MTHTSPPPAPKKSTNGRKSVRDLRHDPRVRLLRHTFAWTSRVSPRLTAAAALRLFLRPSRHRRPDREHALLAQALPVVGVEGVAAWQWGLGPVVLLVHGWEGRGAQLGAFVEPLVRAGFRVVAFDAPAHGESAGSEATLLDFARAVEAVAARVGPVRAVVAHSFGCAGVTLALARGLSVRAAVFVAPPVRLADGAKVFADLLGLSPAVRADMRAQIEARVGLPWEQLDAAALAPQRETPLLVVHDHEDAEVPWAAGAELVRAWPRATLLSTRGLGHRRILRDPGVVGAAVELIGALATELGGPSDLDRELDVLLADHQRPVIRPSLEVPVLAGPRETS